MRTVLYMNPLFLSCTRRVPYTLWLPGIHERTVLYMNPLFLSCTRLVPYTLWLPGIHTRTVLYMNPLFLVVTFVLWLHATCSLHVMTARYSHANCPVYEPFVLVWIFVLWLHATCSLHVMTALYSHANCPIYDVLWWTLCSWVASDVLHVMPAEVPRLNWHQANCVFGWGVRQAGKAREYVKVTYAIGSSQHCLDEQKITQKIVLACTLIFSTNWCHNCITWIFYVPWRKDCFTWLLLIIPCDFKNLHTGYKDDIFWG
jgi:hypothetical protein